MGYAIFCPACGHGHTFRIASDQWYAGQVWQFNGDFEKPTFTPSLVNKSTYGEDHQPRRCHLIITDGKITYCDDCTHAMAGKTIDLLPFPGDYHVPSPDDPA